MSSSIPSFTIDLNPILGPIFIGVVCAAMFHGFTTLQTILYYMNYPKDSLFLKIFVFSLWILDSLSLAMISHGAYSYMITNFMNPLVLENVDWGIATEGVVSGLIAFAVHLFLCHRIWGLNKKLAPLVIVFVLISILTYVFTLLASYYGVSDTSNAQKELNISSLHWTVTTALATSMAVDLFITATICLQLYTNRTGIRQTDRMIDLLILYTVTSGLLPALVSIACLVVNLAAPNTLILEAFNAVYSKCYANAMLATLNSRHSVASRTSDSIQDLTDLQFHHNKSNRPNATTSDSSELRNFDFSSTKLSGVASGPSSNDLSTKVSIPLVETVQHSSGTVMSEV